MWTDIPLNEESERYESDPSRLSQLIFGRARIAIQCFSFSAPLHAEFAMAMVLIQRVLRGHVFPPNFGRGDFSDPSQSNEILTVGGSDMANNIAVKDASGITQSVKTTESGGVHTPGTGSPTCWGRAD